MKALRVGMFSRLMTLSGPEIDVCHVSDGNGRTVEGCHSTEAGASSDRGGRIHFSIARGRVFSAYAFRSLTSRLESNNRKEERDA